MTRTAGDKTPSPGTVFALVWQREQRLHSAIFSAMELSETESEFFAEPDSADCTGISCEPY